MPRLHPAEPEASDGPVVEIVGTAFRGGSTTTREVRDHNAFENYFPTESLFQAAGAEEDLEPEDPYAVLGLTPDASWTHVRVRRRELAKDFHPDRFVGRPPAEQAAAEEALRRINAAVADIARDHPESDRRP